jgi:hypothetical protein
MKYCILLEFPASKNMGSMSQQDTNFKLIQCNFMNYMGNFRAPICGFWMFTFWFNLFKPSYHATVLQTYILCSTKYISQTRCPLVSFSALVSREKSWQFHLGKVGLYFLTLKDRIEDTLLPVVWSLTIPTNIQTGFHIPEQISTLTSPAEWLQKLIMTGKWVL